MISTQSTPLKIYELIHGNSNYSRSINDEMKALIISSQYALSTDDFPHILTQLLPLFKNFEYVDLIFQKNHFLVTNHPYFNVFKYYY